jgi:hypothetical protein
MHSAQDVFNLLKYADPLLVERIYHHTLQVLSSANAGQIIPESIVIDPELEIQHILDACSEASKQADTP